MPENESDSLFLYSDTFAGLEQLDSVVGQYSVFLNGENHLFTESNARLWLKMIKYLHAKAGVRNIMFEYGHSYGQLVDEYIQTGDSSLYDAVENFGYIEYSRAIHDLMEWNLSLDSVDRVRFVAIDIDRGVYPMMKLMDHLIPDEYEAHDSIILHLETIRSLAAYNQFKLLEQEEDGYAEFDYHTTSTMQRIQENFLAFEEEYRKVLGPEFERFREVIVDRFNIRTTYRDYEDNYAAQQYVYREMFMHQEFLRQAEQRPGGWFGQFGRCHTTQSKVNSNSCEWYMFRSLANRIKNTKGGRYADSLLSIAILYDDDRTLGVEFSDYEDHFDSYFESMDPNSLVLMDLSQDSTLDSLLGPDFDFVFLNSYGLEMDDFSYMNDFSPDDIDGRSFRFRLRLNVGTQQFDLANLNNALAAEGVTDGFAEVFSSIGLEWESGFSNSTKFPLYTAFSFNFFQTDTLKTGLNNGTQMTLSGWNAGMHYRYNLIPSKQFELGPGIGFYYHQLNFKVFQEDPGLTQPLLNGFLGANRTSTFRNPGFTVAPSAHLNVELNWFSVGVEAGYVLDLSNRKWTSGGQLIEDSFKTSLGGLYVNAKFGLSVNY